MGTADMPVSLDLIAHGSQYTSLRLTEHLALEEIRPASVACRHDSGIAYKSNARCRARRP